MHVWAYVFITTQQPRKAVQAIRKIRGVIKADAWTNPGRHPSRRIGFTPLALGSC